MKKFYVLLIVFSAFALTTNAQQIADNTIGLRFGANDGFGTEFSYQRKLTSNNRLEVDLGIRGNDGYNAFKVTGLYQWVWQLENKFNWYAGFGGGLGNWKDKGTDTSSTSVFASGVIGVEYNFDIPLLISLDFRPEVGFSNYYDGFNSDIGIALRYQF